MKLSEIMSMAFELNDFELFVKQVEAGVKIAGLLMDLDESEMPDEEDAVFPLNPNSELQEKISKLTVEHAKEQIDIIRTIFAAENIDIDDEFFETLNYNENTDIYEENNDSENEDEEDEIPEKTKLEAFKEIMSKVRGH